MYSATKFFVEAVSQGLRLETAGTGIKVTSIQPGNIHFIFTGRRGRKKGRKEGKDKWLDGWMDE